MKKIIYDRKKRILLLISVYILALILSMCAIIIYPLSRQKSFYLKHAREVAQNYINEGGELPLWMDGRDRIAVYDTDGNILYDAANDKKFMKTIDNEKYLPEILSGTEIFHLATGREAFSFLDGFIGIAGVPVILDENIIGAAFYMRKIIAITESAISFAVLFTILYWMSSYFIISSILKQKKLDEERQLYVDNFTHALKTPVASIKVLAEALCDGVVSDPLKLQMYYGLILNETTRQSRMINQILNLSKLQSGKKDMSKHVISAEALFGSVIERYEKLADLVEINLHVDEQIYSMPDLYTNDNGINEILQILLDNALKYVPEGHNIWLSADNNSKNITVCVKDDGDGILPEDMPHIFDRFYKGQKEEQADGSGLGLAIAKEIIDILGENIWAKSEPGKGTQFYFTVQCSTK